jgi:hypothetical protein
MIDGRKFADAGFPLIGTPYSVMDCQKFVEKCAEICGIKIDLAGSNSWYRYIMEHGRVLTPEQCVKELGCVPAGAILFIVNHDGKEPEKFRADGKGNASHMGICTIPRGKGAIHSSASRGGVCESEFKGKTIKNGGWNMVGLWDQVIYDYTQGGGALPDPEPDPAPVPDPTPAEFAVVGNVPEGNRQDVNFRVKPSTTAVLIDRIPCGETVQVIDRADKWSKIKWHGYTGFIMTEYLIFTEEEPDALYCVTIHDLSRDEAESIVDVFGGSITEERG